MTLRKLIYKVDRETGEIIHEVSPSKVIAWGFALAVLAFLTIWLIGYAETGSGNLKDLLVVGGGGGALAYGFYSRAGDLLDVALDRLRERGRP